MCQSWLVDSFTCFMSADVLFASDLRFVKDGRSPLCPEVRVEAGIDTGPRVFSLFITYPTSLPSQPPISTPTMPRSFSTPLPFPPLFMLSFRLSLRLLFLPSPLRASALFVNFSPSVHSTCSAHFNHLTSFLLKLSFTSTYSLPCFSTLFTPSR